jgi:hypothetical protein
MPRFLFWNYRYNGPGKEELLVKLVYKEKIDVLILAESSIDPGLLGERLGAQGRSYVTPHAPHNRLKLFAGYPDGCFRDWARDEERLCLRRFKVAGHPEILIGAVHLVSGLHRERAERKAESDPLARTIREAQRELGHARTVVVGDFNLNPFDDGMIFPDGFGAMMTKSLVRKNAASRGDRFGRFYNPIWSRLGQDVESGAPGTYYWRYHRALNIYWNYLDQVLIGFDLLDHFPEERFRILTEVAGSDGNQQLIRETELHWTIELSDHLPLLFDLDLPQEGDHV